MLRCNILDDAAAARSKLVGPTWFHNCHRSHFGSRYKSGCCENASLLYFDPRSILGVRTFGLISRRLYPEQKADSTLRCSQAVPHPSTDRALRRLTSEVGRDPVHSTRYGRRRSTKSLSGTTAPGTWSVRYHRQASIKHPPWGSNPRPQG